jgi:hypothetical protein
MPQIRIPIEWYDLIFYMASTRRKKFSDFLDYILHTDECIGLNEVSPTAFRKISLSSDVSENEISRKIKYFLFCR